MSFQAVTWAIAQTTGSPSAKATLWSIANYASEHWVAYPKQDTIATDSEQSVDSVQRRIDVLIETSLLRRVKLKRYGRRTHDFLILAPSPLFRASVEEILPFLPAGCDVIEDKHEAVAQATADCGSDKNDSVQDSSEDSASHVTADCGSQNLSTLPQSAVDATALVRQQEYITNQESLPQTPSHPGTEQGLSKEEKPPDDPRFTELCETYALHALSPVLSNPDAVKTEVAAFTEDQWRLCLLGARGVAAVRQRDPKTKGIVGLQRYVRAPDLWQHYAAFAQPDRPPPVQRYWVECNSEEWRARAVLYAIIDRPMPVLRERPDSAVRGAEFAGKLPPAGMALSRFFDAPLIVLDAEKSEDRQRIAAWCERIKECLGIEFRPGQITMPGTITKEMMGKIYELPVRIKGMRVPDNPDDDGFPPRKTTIDREVETTTTE